MTFLFIDDAWDYPRFNFFSSLRNLFIIKINIKYEGNYFSFDKTDKKIQIKSYKLHLSDEGR